MKQGEALSSVYWSSVMQVCVCDLSFEVLKMTLSG